MKRKGIDTGSVVTLACLVAALSWNAMPLLSQEPGRPASEATVGVPTLPFSMKFTKLPDRHIPDDVATYDSPLSTVVMDGEFWVINHDAWKYKGQPVLRYKGTSFDDLVRQPDGTFDNLATNLKGDPQPAGNAYMLGGMWYDSKGKKLYAPLHTEYQNGPEVARRTRLATSTDKGMTWHFEGDIFTRDYPAAVRNGWQFSGSYWEGGPGDFCLYVDERGGYFYLYANDFVWPKTHMWRPSNGGWENSQTIENHTPKDSLCRLQVARCAISDKMAPGKWHKFYKGTWSEPAIGGRGSYVPAYRVTYNKYLGKYIGTSWSSTMFVCSDLSKQDWTPKIAVEGNHWGSMGTDNSGGTFAWHLMNMAGTDAYTCDRTFLVYGYWNGGANHVVQVEFGPGKTVGLEYREAIYSQGIVRHQQIPGLMYGYEPMAESADPIEGRQTRIVGCANSEMAYTGRWSDRSDPEYYGGVAKVCGVAGATVEFSFQGAEVYWRAVAAPDGGKADVFMDGKLEQTVDFYGYTTPGVSARKLDDFRGYLTSLLPAGDGEKETVLLMPFFKTGLDPKAMHTIRIVVRGDKNPQSKGTLIKHMAFEYSAESYRAAAGFCSVMGKNNWHYQKCGDGKYGDLKFYGWRGAANDNDPNNANLWCDAEKGSRFWDETCDVLPCAAADKCVVGNNYQIADENDSVRKWVAPHDGKVRIEGRLEIEKKDGAGVYAGILKNASEAWPSRLVTFGTAAAHDLTIDVSKGDAVCFVVKRNGLSAGEKVFWDPAITYLP